MLRLVASTGRDANPASIRQRASAASSISTPRPGPPVRCRCPPSTDALTRRDRVGEQQRGREAVRELAPAAPARRAPRPRCRPARRARSTGRRAARARSRTPSSHAADLRELHRRRIADRRRRARVGDRHDALVGRQLRRRCAPAAPPCPQGSRTGCSASSSGPIASSRAAASSTDHVAVRVHPDARVARQRRAHRVHRLDVAVDPGLQLERPEPAGLPVARLRRHVRRCSRDERRVAAHRPGAPRRAAGGAGRPRALPSRSQARQLDREQRLRARASAAHGAVRSRGSPARSAAPSTGRQRSRSASTCARSAPPRSASGAASPRPSQAVRAQPHERQLAALEAPASRSRTARGTAARTAPAPWRSIRISPTAAGPRTAAPRRARAASRCAPARRSARARRCGSQRSAATARTSGTASSGSASHGSPSPIATPSVHPNASHSVAPNTAIARRRPSRTASVRLPARRSVSMSRMLLTIRIAADSNPTGTASSEGQPGQLLGLHVVRADHGDQAEEREHEDLAQALVSVGARAARVEDARPGSRRRRSPAAPSPTSAIR